MIAEVKKKYSLSNSEIARQLGLGYTTLMRWKRRL
jgi:DNA-binding transcriptional regulator YiaG